jgi:hypothetical protein
MCLNQTVLDALLVVSQELENPIHTRCLEILCNLTRFPSNAEDMAVHYGLVPTLLHTAASEGDEDRVWALRMLQNISASQGGKNTMSTEFALELLSMSVLRTQADEKKAAIAALYNLSTEPGCIVALTNTKDVVSSLVLVANDPNTQSDMRLLVCDTLATLGLWLQTLAGEGTVPPEVNEAQLPSFKTAGWNRWD